MAASLSVNSMVVIVTPFYRFANQHFALGS